MKRLWILMAVVGLVFSISTAQRHQTVFSQDTIRNTAQWKSYTLPTSIESYMLKILNTGPGVVYVALTPNDTLASDTTVGLSVSPKKSGFWTVYYHQLDSAETQSYFMTTTGAIWYKTAKINTYDSVAVIKQWKR